MPSPPKRLLSLFMRLIFLAGLLLAPIALLAGAIIRPFFWNGMQLVLLSILTIEKMWSMFFRMPQRFRATVQQDWTTVSVGLSFTAVMYLVLIEQILPLTAWRSLTAASVGGLLLAVGIGLRYWATLHLGRQWVIHLDQDPGDRHLVTDGPYRWVRHPLYLAACLEALGIPLLFNAFGALIVAIVVFVPFEVHRAGFEERFLEATFGDAYRTYRKRTRGFIPLKR